MWYMSFAYMKIIVQKEEERAREMNTVCVYAACMCVDGVEKSEANKRGTQRE